MEIIIFPIIFGGQTPPGIFVGANLISDELRNQQQFSSDANSINNQVFIKSKNSFPVYVSKILFSLLSFLNILSSDIIKSPFDK